jgi:hypothetical protein
LTKIRGHNRRGNPRADENALRISPEVGSNTGKTAAAAERAIDGRKVRVARSYLSALQTKLKQASAERLRRKYQHMQAGDVLFGGLGDDLES